MQDTHQEKWYQSLFTTQRHVSGLPLETLERCLRDRKYTQSFTAGFALQS